MFVLLLELNCNDSAPWRAGGGQLAELKAVGGLGRRSWWPGVFKIPKAARPHRDMSDMVVPLLSVHRCPH
jgi:hypothetical protein